MPFRLEDLQKAYLEYLRFSKNSKFLHHDRFIFPFFCGSYFSYRKVDVKRIVSIAKSLSPNPKYLDYGCGFGDFLEKVKEFIPNAIGFEKEATIFYGLNRTKPPYIFTFSNIEILDFYDVVFVGWMEPGTDFRKEVSKITDCVITTFDTGGQCGIYGGCDYEEFGFVDIAQWKTPSWIDLNYELMNKYYSNIPKKMVEDLHNLRSAHNIWHVFAKPSVKDIIISSLKEQERSELNNLERFDFEDILDEMDFKFQGKLSSYTDESLWKIKYNVCQ